MTRTERLVRGLRNNKLVAIAILLGGIVIGLATFKDALVKLSEPFFKREPKIAAKIDIADILVSKSHTRLDPGWHEKFAQVELDFRVQNVGNQAGSISRVRFNIVKIKPQGYMNSTADIMRVVHPARLSPSAKYDLDITHSSGVDELPVSHTLEPGETDRFVITVISKERGQWTLKPTLVTSAGVVEGKSVTLRFLLQ
jgi:hypothetical protein